MKLFRLISACARSAIALLLLPGSVNAQDIFIVDNIFTADGTALSWEGTVSDDGNLIEGRGSCNPFDINDPEASLPFTLERL